MMPMNAVLFKQVAAYKPKDSILIGFKKWRVSKFIRQYVFISILIITQALTFTHIHICLVIRNAKIQKKWK